MEHAGVPEQAYLTWTELDDLLRLHPVGLLPVGAIEAHGPHLPLNTDVIIATGMARQGGGQLYQRGIPSIILPAVAYSVSFAGACFSGTTPVTAETFSEFLRQVITQHARQGYRAICICNAHLEPQHVAAVVTAVEACQNDVGIPIAFPDKRESKWASKLGAEFMGGSRHAGGYETSMVMAEAPEFVRRMALEELEPLWIDLPAALREGATDFAEAGSKLGYFGDPRSATPEFGNELLNTLGSMICESVVERLARP